MLESYEHEVIRKKRAAKVFWLLVFSFAIFLYFFFQGYYPSFDFSLRSYFSSGELQEIDREDLVKSFGVVNIRVEPRDARIQLS
jgi:cbb3-type cytochrome oxidase subunit 1